MTNYTLYASSLKVIQDKKAICKYIVTLDDDAAEIMGETKMVYRFASYDAALGFMNVLQSNLDALHDDALAD
jgi:hypothetical protein